MPRDRAAARSAASSSRPARTRSGRPPRRCRDRGNSAAARRRPGGAPRSARHRSRRCRSFHCASGSERADRADFVGPAGIGFAELARDIERLVEILAVDDIKAEQLLLGFGIGAVDHQRRILLAQGGRRRGRQQPRHRAEPTLLGKLFLHHRELLHDRLVLLLAPGADEVLIVIAKDGVKHVGRVSVHPRNERLCPEPTAQRRDFSAGSAPHMPPRSAKADYQETPYFAAMRRALVSSALSRVLAPPCLAAACRFEPCDPAPACGPAPPCWAEPAPSAAPACDWSIPEPVEMPLADSTDPMSRFWACAEADARRRADMMINLRM